jgi:histidyl-tRNA synthetase
MAYGDRGLKGAMKAADKSGATYALVIGDDEIATGTCELKLMSSGEVISSTLAASDLIVKLGTKN